MNATNDHSMPESMRHLVRLALETGLDRVSIGFEGLSADFPAPIGWSLHLNRVDEMLAEDRKSNHLTVSCQIGSDATAYVGPVDSQHPYLDAAQIAAWITTPRAGIADYTAAETAQFSRDSDLFLEAISNGWEPSRELRRHDASMFAKYAGDQPPLPMSVMTRFSALNWFYNIEGHPACHTNGTPVSENLTLIRASITEGTTFYSDIDGHKTAEALIFQMISARAPWFAEVAYYDDELEEWVY